MPLAVEEFSKMLTKQKNLQYIRYLDTLSHSDVNLVGGKNASLGEMIQQLERKGVRVPGGFATTAEAYWLLINENGLKQPISDALQSLKSDQTSLKDTGKHIRELIQKASIPKQLEDELRHAYKTLSQQNKQQNTSVAARSSATAEDLPNASFAGQQETYLNISGEDAVLKAFLNCCASLFTDRAISYRNKNNFDHMKVALSVGFQKMVRSDKHGAGVMFSIDPETGFPNVVVISAAWGLGEAVVQGQVDTDEYQVFKPLLNKQTNSPPIIHKHRGEKKQKIIYADSLESPIQTVETSPDEQQAMVLNDKDIITLAQWANIIEEHYQTPMDMEWAKDGETGEVYIVQARPETVHSQKSTKTFKRYQLKETTKPIITGVSVGSQIAVGKIHLAESVDDTVNMDEGSILVTSMTEPDWGPALKKAGAIITNTGGRTSHAAIVSREFGIPAIVSTGNATNTLKHGQIVTVSCSEGDRGCVYEGKLNYEAEDINLNGLPEPPIDILLNIASPQGAFQWWPLPATGIGLARMEFIISNFIQIHPLALIHYDQLEDNEVKKNIDELTRGYDCRTQYFIDQLSQGISKITASQYPNPVIVRLSDFKSHEYATLIGGEQFEPDESNPMLGLRGASRYYSELFQPAFELECKALYQVKEMGFDNLIIMVPFVRTLKEAKIVLELLSNYGLKRSASLKIYMMAELPSNVFLAEEFAKLFDGFSIGSNDLTQFVLGVDRDSEALNELYDETDQAVKQAIIEVITKAHKQNIPVGFCGQAPSDNPDFSNFLKTSGIDSISVNPDSFVKVVKIIS